MTLLVVIYTDIYFLINQLCMCCIKQREKCFNSSGDVFKLLNPRNNLLALTKDKKKQKIFTVKKLDPSDCLEFMLGNNLIDYEIVAVLLF